jgi:hypothetical protein
MARTARGGGVVEAGCVVTLQRRLGHKEPRTFWCDPERDSQRIYAAASNRGEPWSHAAGTRPWRGDARWTESLEWKRHARTNMAAAARVAINVLECSIIINGRRLQDTVTTVLRQEYNPKTCLLVSATLFAKQARSDSLLVRSSWHNQGDTS